MWKFISKIVLALSVFAASFLFSNHQKPDNIPLPCQEPIAYTIGAFDRRFAISYQDFLDALAKAEAIWEQPLGQALFVYAPEKAQLPINLIYDYRQETTSALSSLGGAVKEDEAGYSALRASYIGLKTKYDSAKSFYDARVEKFNERNSTYRAHIESWNKGDRTSRAQFDQLEKEQIALEMEAAELKTLAIQLNAIASAVNTLVDTLNRLVNSLKLNVAKYNTIGASRGESFTGGIYYSAEGVRGIDVYEFSSREKLVRIMAHELGHALGLEHVDDRDAIMYRFNEGEAEVLTPSDLVSLRALCGMK